MLNVLRLALNPINRIAGDHTFEYRLYEGDETTDFGVVRPAYSEWKSGYGSVQPQDASCFEMEGAEPAKRAVTVWAMIDFKTLDVQEHCDQIRYGGRVYNCARRTNWFGQNGWSTFSCTEDKYEETT